MRYFHRLALFILTILFLFLTFALSAYAFGFVPRTYLPLLVETIYLQTEVAIVSLVFFLLGIGLLLTLFDKRQQSQTIVQANQRGEVRITKSALKELVERLVLERSEIKSVNVKFDIHENMFNLLLKLSVNPEGNLPTLSNDLKENVTNYLADVVGIQVDDLRVVINEIETMKKNSSSTVRVR